MIINYFYVKRVTVFPTETNAPLVVDSNAVLSFTASLEALQPIGRRNPEIGQGFGAMEHPKFP